VKLRLSLTGLTEAATNPADRPIVKNQPPVLLSYAFRPFFLLGAVFAVLTLIIWLLTLHGVGLPGVTPYWHAHEMLFGLAMAAVAGFSLTAVANWTGRPAVKGAPLFWLLVSWMVGRLAMLFTLSLPAPLILTLDSFFPLLLCFLLGKEIIAGKSHRNFPIIAILVLVVLLNLLFHLGSGGWLPGSDRLSLYLLIHCLLLLITIIAGRITPVFTGNWLRQQGSTLQPVNSNALTLAAIVLTLLVGLSASFAPTHVLTGVLAFAAGLTHAYRLSQWKGLSTTSNPLLFVLHVAYLWLPIGYALLACAVFGWLFTPTAALHALTMGVIGGMVLAVTTRVSLGHTGRPLEAARLTVLAYWLLTLSVIFRVLSPLSTNKYMLMIDLSATSWVLAFGLFLWVYWPILTRAKPVK
jgi:uncharacterized protein involved in response to NO